MCGRAILTRQRVWENRYFCRPHAKIKNQKKIRNPNPRRQRRCPRRCRPRRHLVCSLPLPDPPPSPPLRHRRIQAEAGCHRPSPPPTCGHLPVPSRSPLLPSPPPQRPAAAASPEPIAYACHHCSPSTSPFPSRRRALPWGIERIRENEMRGSKEKIRDRERVVRLRNYIIFPCRPVKRPVYENWFLRAGFS